MENNIPTAENLFESIVGEKSSEFNYCITDAMIKFAKLHVEAALKEANKNVSKSLKNKDFWPDEESILNAYPLNNIK